MATVDEAKEFIIEHNLRLLEQSTLVYCTVNGSWYLYEINKHGWRKLHWPEIDMDVRIAAEYHVNNLPPSEHKQEMYNRVNDGSLRKLVIDLLAHDRAIKDIPRPVVP